VEADDRGVASQAHVVLPSDRSHDNIRMRFYFQFGVDFRFRQRPAAQGATIRLGLTRG